MWKKMFWGGAKPKGLSYEKAGGQKIVVRLILLAVLTTKNTFD